jgi:hypothetical protein
MGKAAWVIVQGNHPRLIAHHSSRRSHTRWIPARTAALVLCYWKLVLAFGWVYKGGVYDQVRRPLHPFELGWHPRQMPHPATNATRSPQLNEQLDTTTVF